MYYTQGFQKIFKDLGVKIAFKTKCILEHFLRKVKDKTDSSEKFIRYGLNCNDCNKAEDLLKQVTSNTRVI